MLSEDYVGAKTASGMLGISIRWFQELKRRGELPDPEYVDGRPLYRKSQFEGLNVRKPRGGGKGRPKKKCS